jgi:hypothetical protein
MIFSESQGIVGWLQRTKLGNRYMYIHYKQVEWS